MAVPFQHRAVMAQRREPPDALDDFPTPPWATRAGAEIVRELDPRALQVLEPACGRGIMAQVLLEYFPHVVAGDVFDYGRGYPVADFLGQEWAAPPTQRLADYRPDWIFTNPPFNAAEQFVHLGLQRATRGVAILARLQFLEGGGRYRRLFGPTPPTVIAQFVDRAPMVRGRWDPEAGTATAYAWFIWSKLHEPRPFRWIPPGTRERTWHVDDVRRFTEPAPLPLFTQAAE